MNYTRKDALIAIAEKIDRGLCAVCVGDYVTGWMEYIDVKAVGNARSESGLKDEYERLEEALLLNPENILMYSHIKDEGELALMISRRFIAVLEDLNAGGYEAAEEDAARSYAFALLIGMEWLKDDRDSAETSRLYQKMYNVWNDFIEWESMNSEDEDDDQGPIVWPYDDNNRTEDAE